MTATAPERARYTVVSADGHAGGDIQDYRPYLASRWHDEFDAWAAEYVNPFADLLAPIAYRNWDSARRLAETESDGIAAEVLFPNTVPPFFTEGNLVALPPTPEDYERRWAGVQAHNRWLADFCAATPGRRAGIIQVFANDMADAVARGALGRRDLRPLRRHPAALHPAQLRAAAAVGGPLRAAVAGVRRSRRAHQHPRRQRACPTTASTRRRGP